MPTHHRTAAHVPAVQPVTDRESESISALLDEFARATAIPEPVARFCAGARVGRKFAAHPGFVNTALPRLGGNR